MIEKNQLISKIEEYIVGKSGNPITGFALYWLISEIVNQVYIELGVEDNIE